MAFQMVHPAPGFGDLMKGWFVLPQNPLTGQKELSVIPGMGDIMQSGGFVVPQNPLMKQLSGMGSIGCGGYGCGGTDVSLMGGLGEFNLSDITSPVSNMFSGMSTQTLFLLGGAALLLIMMSGRSKSDRSEYRRELTKLREKYPTRYGRGRRAYQAAREAW